MNSYWILKIKMCLFSAFLKFKKIFYYCLKNVMIDVFQVLNNQIWLVANTLVQVQADQDVIFIVKSSVFLNEPRVSIVTCSDFFNSFLGGLVKKNLSLEKSRQLCQYHVKSRKVRDVEFECTGEHLTPVEDFISLFLMDSG